MSDPTFDRSGLASLDDLSSPTWRRIFSELESIQNEFLSAEPHCSDYPWPRDPLHNCIRVWEYPFVYHHLQTERARITAQNPRVVDLGSGATFFSFAVARLGWEVTAVDADPKVLASIDRAVSRVSAGPGRVRSLASDARAVALDAESVDCVYCISVLEHIPECERVIAEIQRILRPGGLCVLTFDVDLRGNWDLGPEAYRRVSDALQASFSFGCPEKFVHPLSALTTDNSIYPMYPPSSAFGNTFALFKRSLRSTYNRVRGLTPPSGRLLATTYGACLRKNGSTGVPRNSE